jgi:arsenite oxidase small subunit
MPDAPAWKEDFPIAWTDDHFVTRREFTKSLVLVSCATFAANATVSTLGLLQKPGQEPFPEIRVANASALAVGGSLVFNYPGPSDACLLVRVDNERFVAFSQSCTHLGCPVHFQAESRRLYCPCHEGFFSSEDGHVLAGPPPRPLPQILIEKRGDELWATGRVG